MYMYSIYIHVHEHVSLLAVVCHSPSAQPQLIHITCRSFSQMKLFNTRLRNRLGEASLTHLMTIIAIESPEILSDSDLHVEVVTIWNRKASICSQSLYMCTMYMYCICTMLNLEILRGGGAPGFQEGPFCCPPATPPPQMQP